MNRRPKLSLLASSASPEEAAAIIAALERFMRDTSPPPAQPAPKPGPWQQQGLHEGVAREPRPPLPWT